jgi:hypothetical protein
MVGVSHFDATVCLPPTPPDQAVPALTDVLAPFDINKYSGREDDWNPDGQWDRWRLDGGIEERLAVKPEYEGDPRLIHRRTEPNGEPRERLPLQCDGGPRGLLDLDRMIANDVAQTRVRWRPELEDWKRLVAEHPPALPLAMFLARHQAEPDAYARQQAIAEHTNQPLIRAWARLSEKDDYPNLGPGALHRYRGRDSSDPIAHYSRDEHDILDREAAWVIPTFALLTLDGQWADAEQPGSFATGRLPEDRSIEYARNATAYLQDLDPDAMIVRLVCHC